LAARRRRRGRALLRAGRRRARSEGPRAAAGRGRSARAPGARSPWLLSRPCGAATSEVDLHEAIPAGAPLAAVHFDPLDLGDRRFDTRRDRLLDRRPCRRARSALLAQAEARYAVRADADDLDLGAVEIEVRPQAV